MYKPIIKQFLPLNFLKKCYIISFSKEPNNFSFLEQKATSLTLESHLDDERKIKGDAAKEGDIQVALLANLQEQQENEAALLLNDLGSKVSISKLGFFLLKRTEKEKRN